MALWAVTILGALIGGLLLGIYQAWAVRRGFTARSSLVWDAGAAGGDPPPAPYPTWRRLWPWLLLSLVVLAIGLVLSIMGANLAGGA